MSIDPYKYLSVILCVSMAVPSSQVAWANLPTSPEGRSQPHVVVEIKGDQLENQQALIENAITSDDSRRLGFVIVASGIDSNLVGFATELATNIQVARVLGRSFTPEQRAQYRKILDRQTGLLNEIKLALPGLLHYQLQNIPTSDIGRAVIDILAERQITLAEFHAIIRSLPQDVFVSRDAGPQPTKQVTEVPKSTADRTQILRQFEPLSLDNPEERSDLMGLRRIINPEAVDKLREQALAEIKLADQYDQKLRQSTPEMTAFGYQKLHYLRTWQAKREGRAPVLSTLEKLLIIDDISSKLVDRLASTQANKLFQQMGKLSQLVNRAQREGITFDFGRPRLAQLGIVNEAVMTGVRTTRVADQNQADRGSVTDSQGRLKYGLSQGPEIEKLMVQDGTHLERTFIGLIRGLRHLSPNEDIGFLMHKLASSVDVAVHGSVTADGKRVRSPVLIGEQTSPTLATILENESSYWRFQSPALRNALFDGIAGPEALGDVRRSLEFLLAQHGIKLNELVEQMQKLDPYLIDKLSRGESQSVHVGAFPWEGNPHNHQSENFSGSEIEKEKVELRPDSWRQGNPPGLMENLVEGFKYLKNVMADAFLTAHNSRPVALRKGQLIDILGPQIDASMIRRWSLASDEELARAEGELLKAIRDAGRMRAERAHDFRNTRKHEGRAVPLEKFEHELASKEETYTRDPKLIKLLMTLSEELSAIIISTRVSSVSRANPVARNSLMARAESALADSLSLNSKGSEQGLPSLKGPKDLAARETIEKRVRANSPFLKRAQDPKTTRAQSTAIADPTSSETDRTVSPEVKKSTQELRATIDAKKAEFAARIAAMPEEEREAYLAAREAQRTKPVGDQVKIWGQMVRDQHDKIKYGKVMPKGEGIWETCLYGMRQLSQRLGLN
ncbi:MAG: hypothetical protein IT289_00690 [Oligoflexia bacterium]|nr:hypothetical protein [Oligoflexia bacterium]